LRLDEEDRALDSPIIISIMLGASCYSYEHRNVERDDAYTDPGSLSIGSDEDILPDLVN
jgi:hypothetical protein